MSEVKQRVWLLGWQNIQKVAYRVRCCVREHDLGLRLSPGPTLPGTTALAAPKDELCGDGVRALVGHEVPRRPPGSVRGREAYR